MEQLFGAIPSVLKGLEANADLDKAVVFAAWSRCAGDLLRTRTAPLEFFENRLVIAVQDGTWRRHLEYLSPQMLVKLNGSLGRGPVRFIEFCVDADAVATDRNTKNKPGTANVSAEITPALANAAEAIADERLREQFLRAAASYLGNQK